MRKILLTCFMLVAFMTSYVIAQDRAVSGKVTSSEDGNPLPGVNVILKGSGTGTTTDIDGNYKLNVPSDGGVLVFTFIGQKTTEVSIGARSVIDVSMLPDVETLGEVIVTGVASGTSAKKLGFSIGKVNEETLREVPAVDPANALRGKVSGVQVIQPSGIPGTAPEIRLRGSGTINSSSQGPLIIVDGIITTNSLADINMNDVESIEVIKGAAGAALYGSLAGNGVVQIITKKGSGTVGETRVTVRNEVGFTALQREFPLSNSHAFMLDADGDFLLANPNNPTTRLYTDEFIMDQPYPRTFNQQRELFGNRSFMNNVVQVGSSTVNTNFFVSFDNLVNEPIIEGLPAYNRRAVRFNIDHYVTDKLKITANTSYGKSTGPQATERGQAGVIYGVLLVEPDLDLRTPAADGQPFSPGLRFNGNGVNPLYEANIQRWERERDRLMGNFAASYELTDYLRFEAQYSMDKLFMREEFGRPINYLTPSSPPQGTGGNLDVEYLESTANVYTATAYFKKSFGDLNVRSALRYQVEQYLTNGSRTLGSNFVLGGIPQFQAIERSTLQATSFNQEVLAENIFLNLSLDYKDKYIFEGLIRQDGSSLFGEDQRYQNFGRITGAYRINEDLKLPGIQEWKLRASYGVAGDRPQFSWQYETYTLSQGTATKNILGNRDLRPAKLHELEIGTNIAFGNRFDFEFTYSSIDGRDQIFLVPLSAAAGFRNQWRNAGRMVTNTFEAAFSAALVKNNPNFSWNMTLVGSRTMSVVTELDVPEYNVNGGTTDGIFRIKEGGMFGDMWGARHLKSVSELQVDENGHVMNVSGYVFGGVNNRTAEDFVVNRHGYLVPAGSIGTTTEQAVLEYDPETGLPLDSKIGTSIPNAIFGLTSNMKYKNFGLYVLFDAQLGGNIYNATKQLLYFNERHADLDQADVPAEDRTAYTFWANATSLYNGNNSTEHFVEDASFVKVREISLSYNFDKKFMDRIGVGNVFHDARFSVIGRNLFTFTNYSGFDPEVALASSPINYRVDEFTVPIFRTFSASLELRF